MDSSYIVSPYLCLWGNIDNYRDVPIVIKGAVRILKVNKLRFKYENNRNVRIKHLNVYIFIKKKINN